MQLISKLKALRLLALSVIIIIKCEENCLTNYHALGLNSFLETKTGICWQETVEIVFKDCRFPADSHFQEFVENDFVVRKWAHGEDFEIFFRRFKDE